MIPPVDDHDPGSDQRRRLPIEAERLGPVTVDRVVLPRSGHVDEILRPTDMDVLLDRVADDPEQNLPYWAEIWPSGIALADAITQRPEEVRGRPVLELGSGIGVTGVAAVRAGAQRTVADYAPEALALCRHNTLRNTAREPATLQLNWPQPRPELFRLAGEGFPLVLTADVLYEARDVDPLLLLLRPLVAPDGLLWLAEPGRPVAARFLQVARAAGWHVESDLHPGPWPDPKDAGVVVSLHRLWRS